MTKLEIAYLIQENILKTRLDLKKKDLSNKVILSVLDNFFEVVKVNLAKGEHIELRGFGTYETRVRKPKRKINPKTKEFVNVEEHLVPIFRPGKDLKKIVNDNYKKNN
ncbi:MAG: integration host factor subunit beta [Spirochaetes bacterium]|nr:integration host factor subunit beta [Spirochaetota bacterium]